MLKSIKIKKSMILILVILLTIGFASVSSTLILNGKATVAIKKNDVNVMFTKVSLNGIESEDVVLSGDYTSFAYFADNIKNTATIEYDIKNMSTQYDSQVIVSCTTDYPNNIEYTGNTLSQIVNIPADEGHTDTITANLIEKNTDGNSLVVECSLIVNPTSRDTIMLGKEYNVEFDSNGGTEILWGTFVAYYEKYGELPTPTKEGYEFVGWYTQAGQKVDANSIVKTKDNHTLIAKWKEIPTAPEHVTGTYELVVDKNSNKVANIGDEIRVGTEDFYVISHTNTEINALAKYNLKVGGNYDGTYITETIPDTAEGYGRQDSNMKGYVRGDAISYGTVLFSDYDGWDRTNKNVDIRNDEQTEGPIREALYGTNGYENYLKQTISNITVRLITKDELDALGCVADDMMCSTENEWVYSTSYWTQTLVDDYDYGFWVITSDNEYGPDGDYRQDNLWGIRPVITINTFAITKDDNNNGVADMGDEIRVGTEEFHVMSHTATEIKALAKYNLNVGEYKNPNVTEGIQHESVKGWIETGETYGTVAFASQDGWPLVINGTIDIRNNSYGNGPVKDALYGTNGYETYIKKYRSNATVRLINYDELVSLGCSSEDNICSGPEWVYSTSYWTGSSSSDSESWIWYVYSVNDFFDIDYFDYENAGVRPVITIPLS